MKSYRTIAAPAQDQFVERRSRFIGYITPVKTEEEAMAFIASKREEHWDATHNVFAYILREGNLCRFSDDGEPSGTAGKPVLDVLQGRGLTDVAVVVTRYFGGVLLGTGGLTRAYSQGARVAVEAAQVLEMHPCTRLRVVCDYSFYGKLSHICPKFLVETAASDFGEAVTLELLCRDNLLPAFAKELEEQSSGTVIPEPLENLYCPVPVDE